MAMTYVDMLTFAMFLQLSTAIPIAQQIGGGPQIYKGILIPTIYHCKMFRLLQPYFGHLSLCATCKVQGMLTV